MKNLICTKFKQCTLLFLTSFALASCSELNMQKYGYENAYNTTNSGAYRHLASDVSFFVDASVTGNYRTAVDYAINKANNLTDAINIDGDGEINSSFSIEVGYDGTAPYNTDVAWTLPGYNSSTGIISSGIITLNAYHMQSFTLAQMKHVVMHEIGHVFGLKDLSDSRYQPYSVMYAFAPSKLSKYIFSDYQEFDKQNIARKYDN